LGLRPKPQDLSPSARVDASILAASKAAGRTIGMPGRKTGQRRDATRAPSQGRSGRRPSGRLPIHSSPSATHPKQRGGNFPLQCWTLKQIFTIEQFNGRLLFKGGVSLKVFGAVQGVSEDIDPAVDHALLGFVRDRDPTQPRLILDTSTEASGKAGAPSSRLPSGGTIRRPHEAECRKLLKTGGARKRAATLSERCSLVKL